MPTSSFSPTRTTLHKSLGDELLRLIKDGHYPVGTNLPTEMALCEEFSVSRHTVREAIRRLQELGLVVRRARAGTTVVKQYAQPQFGLALETTEQLKHYLETTTLHVARTQKTLTAHPSETRLEGAPEDWLKIATYRRVPGSERPISWTDIYVKQEYSAIAEHVGNQPGGVYPLFEQLFDEVIETIDIEISAATFPAAVAKRLGYGKNDPALLMIRRFRNTAGKLLEVAVSYYPPFDFRYVSRLSRVQGRHQANA